MANKIIDIIVPVKNEARNIETLCLRVDKALTQANISYRLIFVIDQSIDDTEEVIHSLSADYPILIHHKSGRPGKAYSILEGVQLANTEYIAMIDGDLQYPPEAIPAMLAETDRHGLVIAQRVVHHENLIRNTLSKINLFVLGKFLFGASYDFQSGLKIFQRRIVDYIDQRSIRPWSFDIPLLHTTLELGHTVGSVPIIFEQRSNGRSHVNIFSAAYQIVRSAFLAKIYKQHTYHVEPTHTTSMIGAGIIHRRKKFITHSTLPHQHSALTTFHVWQKTFFAIFFATLVIGLLVAPVFTIIIFIACISAIYFIDVTFQLGLVMRSLRKPTEIVSSASDLAAIDDAILPMYSILCPLYKESAVLPQFIQAMTKLKWPKSKLEVLLLLEEMDTETIETAQNLTLPDFIRIVIVPDSNPRTKPKACNYGLNIALGEYVVIYDAEDKPDIWQLKKAYFAFKQVPSDVFCLQAKLNYYNSEQNILTRLFSAEYALWFDLILTGLHSVAAMIPLGGTSNHFRTKHLRLLHGWDSFNVTEDCDLGVRLFKAGYKTAIFDSVTLEEANSNVWNWVRQRSRWIKGYMQTYLVHMRKPTALWQELGTQAFVFQLLIGCKILFMLINPILWITTIVYFSFRASVGPTIEALYPPIVFYVAAFSLVAGNFLYIYYYMIGCAKRQQWPLIKYVFLVPLYWLMISFSALISFWQLLFKPHYWEKTKHGLHLEYKQPEPIEVLEPEMPKPQQWKSLFVGSGLLLGGMMIANVVNFLFNAYLGRTVSLAQISVVALVSTFWNIALLFFGAYAATVNHTVAYAAARGEERKAFTFYILIGTRALGIVLVAALAWIVAIPFLNEFFHLSQVGVAASIVPIFIFGILMYTNIGYFEGRTWFGLVGALYIIEAMTKLTFAILILRAGYEHLIFLVVPLSVAVTTAMSMIFIWFVPSGKSDKNTTPLSFPFPFFAASLLAGISATIFTSIDIVLAKHYLEASAAGEYSLLALLGKIIFFLGALPSALIVTFTSRSDALRTNPIKIFIATFLGTGALIGMGLIVLGPLGPFTAQLLLGDRSAYVLPYLTKYAIAMALFTLSNTVVLYHVARKRYVLAVISFLQAFFVVLSIKYFHRNVGEIVNGMLIAGIASFGVIFLLQLATRAARENIRRAYSDLRDLFVFRLRMRKRASDKMSILIFNWRDMRHALSGGAEKYIQEMAHQWVNHGHTVTLFCGNDGLSPRMEIVGGVQIIRRGGFYLVYLWAFLYYIIRFRRQYDVIIDCHNGIPFFTPLYVRKPIFLVIHHVHQEVFHHSMVRPMAIVAAFLEKHLMPFVYRRNKIITVSQSSKLDITALGMGKTGIEIVHPGIDILDLHVGQKEETPLVLYLGRIKKYKSLDILLKAFRVVLKDIPTARLVIAGDGDELVQLQAIVFGMRIQHAVAFVGKVDHKKKINLLQRAWVVVNPSFKEGWGITTIEANACGTPVVASDVPGLRDSVQNATTGYLVPYGDDAMLAEKLINILQNEPLRTTMSKNARVWAMQFDQLRASEDFLTIIYGRA